MKIALIGHRGTGKTCLLSRMERYFSKEIKVQDLDQLIEKEENQSIADIFDRQGEKTFRAIEERTFLRFITKEINFIIALGAGFPVEKIPADIYVIWVRRASDKLGRVFLDRPKLDKDRDDLEEFHTRAKAREDHFKRRANEIYDLPEGQIEDSEGERKILSKQWSDIHSFLTVQKVHLESQKDFLLDLRDKSSLHFELRDDLLSEAEINLIVREIPKERLLLSARQAQGCITVNFASWEGYAKDWALELGDPVEDSAILSLHGSGVESILARAGQMEDKCRWIKISPEVKNFDDLKAFYQWQQEKPDKRVFLPRSSDGRWNWFRIYMRERQKMHFVQWGESSALDQPTVSLDLAAPRPIQKFAAVLGDPVFHSQSPAFHQKFFADKGWPFFAIRVQETEWDSAIPFLRELGLVAAAVTSPLKLLAGEWAQSRSSLVTALKTANTLTYSDGQWTSHNTDYDGLRKSVPQNLPEPIAIWGGGGTLKVLIELFPQAHAFSASTGRLRQQNLDELSEYKTLIWAAGPTAEMPQKNWAPSFVFDLNYRQDSAALSYAKKQKALYTNGEAMFKAQAELQQLFWDEHL